MKTDTERLKERLAQVKARQASLRQELTSLEADEQRYSMALDVLRSLGEDPQESESSVEGAAVRRRPLTGNVQAGPSVQEGAGLSLAALITTEVFKERDGLTTAEIVAGVQRLQPSAKYASIVSVLSRLIHKTMSLRRDGKLVFRVK